MIGLHDRLSGLRAQTYDLRTVPMLLACAAPAALMMGSLATPALAQGQDASQDSDNAIIVTGTRSISMKAKDSLSPIDVVSGEQLAATGQSNLRDALQQLLPSINRQAQGTTVAALTDFVNLRGLSPNQTLVLVDGKRRHPGTNIMTDAGPFRGATPVDISLIPISMIDHIEVLRDGAAAQYGSDAVAGVINIILKKGAGHGSIAVESGIYAAGDGLTQNVDADQGFSLGDRGYVRVGLSYQHHNRTDRTGTDTRTGLDDSHWVGEPASDLVSTAIKGAYQLTPGIEAYTLLTYAHRTANTYQIYRLPSILPAIYPNGFSPMLGSTENDGAATVGLRGNDLLGWNWDASSTYGTDHISYNMWDSANTTLYANTGSTPTSFHLKDLSSQQLTSDIDLKRSVDLPVLPAPLNIAFGGERRYETFHEGAGDVDSTIYGGSQAVPGVLSTSAGTWDRNVFALYGDLSTQITPKWQIDGAGRWEHYSDFGATWSAKVATRYDFSSAFAIRGTFSTGIRAPTLAEEHHTAATVTTSGATGELPPGSAGAQLLGATPLKPERSQNISVGFTATPIHNLNVTVDAYQIRLKDRILDGGAYSGQLAVDAFLANGRTLPANTVLSAVSASYLTNGADTRTRGIDLSATYRIGLTENSRIVFDASANFNKTSILKIKENLYGAADLNAQQIAYLTTAQPRNSQVAGANWSDTKWSIALHAQRYGKIFDEMTFQQGASAYSTKVFQPYTGHSRTLVNLSVSYNITPKLTGTVGANNLFDTYPTKVPQLARYYGQALYDRYAQQTTFDGGFYYVRLAYRF